MWIRGGKAEFQDNGKNDGLLIIRVKSEVWGKGTASDHEFVRHVSGPENYCENANMLQ